MIGIVDYGVGNLFSLSCSLSSLGQDVVVTGDKYALERCDKIILPGVGAFADARAKLSENDLDKFVVEQAQKGKYLMGICLGMQMLFDKSYEFGTYDGLGLIKGEVVSMRELIPDNLKIPQIGWNDLKFVRDSALYKGLDQGAFVYFVHSYCAVGCDKDLSAYVDYGAKITASVEKDKVFGCQFHPEKSGKVGLTILKNFCELE